MCEAQRFCRDTALKDFFPLPRAILEFSLSNTAILLYALLLDRGTLSQKNGYADRAGQIYVIYTLKHLARALNKSVRTVTTCLKELEQAGLIRRERCGMNSPSRIFLYIPTGSNLPVTVEEDVYCEGKKISGAAGRKLPPNERRKQTERNEDIYRYTEGESL